MNETQKTIGDWAKAAFPGGDDLSPRHAIRLLEEVIELCLATGSTPYAIARTCLFALPGAIGDPANPESPEKVAREMADCAIVLDVMAERRGVDLRHEIDAKMAINRARKWKTRGDGTGYHVKPDDDEPSVPRDET